MFRDEPNLRSVAGVSLGHSLLLLRSGLVDSSADMDDEFRFAEEVPIVISGEDRDAFLAALDNPLPPNDALKRLMSGGK